MNTLKRKLSLLTDKLMHIINEYRITIILGEVDSGKTTLLNEFYEKYKDITMYKSMIALTKKDTIDNTIQFILLDALDEALYYQEEEEVFENLLDFIRQCRDMNSHVKFVISCRNAIWKDKFKEQLQKIDTQYQELQQDIANLPEHKKILSGFIGYDNGLEEDRSIKIYDLEPLSKDEINLYLGNRSDAFWSFVEKNHLIVRNKLLIKNIYHILNLYDNFEQYERKYLKYFEIYDVIIRQHLQAFSDNQRNRQLDTISLDELFKIASAVAFYNIKNSTRFFSTKKIPDELRAICSKIDISIDEQKLKVLGDTALYLSKNFFDDQTIKVSNNSEIESYLAAYYLKDFDKTEIIDLTINDLGIVNGYEDIIYHLIHLKPNLLENYFEGFDMTKMTKDLYKLYIYTKPSCKEILDLWNNIVDAKLNFKKIVKIYNDETYCKKLFDFMKDKNIFNQDKSLYFDESFELKLFLNLYSQEVSISDLLYLMQFISKRERISQVLANKEKNLRIFNQLTKEYHEFEVDKALIEYLIKNILISSTEEEILLKVISFLEQYEITIKDIYFKDFQSNQIETLWNLYFIEGKDIFVYFPNLLYFLKEQSIAYPIDSYVEEYKKLYSKYNKEFLEWDFLLENENFKEEKEVYDNEYLSWDTIIKQKAKKEHTIVFYDRFHFCLNRIYKNMNLDKTLNKCLGVYYDEFMTKLKDEFNQMNFTLNGVKQQNNYCFIDCQYDSKIDFLNVFEKFSNEEMNRFFDTTEMYKKLFWLVFSNEGCNKSPFFEDVSSKIFSLHKKYKETFIKNIKNYIDYWLKNLDIEQMPSFLCNLNDVKEFTLDEIKSLLVYIKSSKDLNKKWHNLSTDDKEFLLLLLEKEKSNFEFIFELMKKDREEANIYLNRLLNIDIEKTINSFLQYYTEEEKPKVLYDQFIKFLKDRIPDFDPFDDNLERGVIQDIMTSLCQHNIKEFLLDGYSFYDDNEYSIFWDYLDKKTLEELSHHIDSNIKLKASNLLKPMYDENVRSKDIGVKHSPRKLVDIFKLFTKENPIKYTSHSFEWSKYGSYQKFIDEVKKEFTKIDNELKLLSPNLHTKISNFLFNEFIDKDKTWGKYKIAFGWSSPQLKEWCEIEEKKNNAKKAIYFPLPKEHQREIDGKTLTTFDDICTVFKDEIEIRDDDKLNRLFEKIEEEVLGFDFEVEYINLENITFYTDVEYFENTITKIFEQFKEKAEHDSILVEADNQESYVDIIIEQRGSTVNKNSEEMKKEIDNGDFEDIKKYLFSLCDWIIEAEFLDGNFRVEYLSENQSVKVLELKEKPQGFRHILRFYK